MKSCSFAGHREVYASGVDEKIQVAIEDIIKTDDSFVFYTGGMGEFDRKCASAVRNAKARHPELNIKLVLVEPYMKNSLNENKEYYEKSFDDIVIPMELAGVHYKEAITQPNRWMIDRSDYLIAFVYRDFGGAYSALRYAQKKDGLVIINLSEKESLTDG